ncbi:MAG: helix-turn-helix domain-containing protein [Phototrophicaceae bacterium]
MASDRFRLIEGWTEADLLDLTAGENDEYEYKSSRISQTDLTKEIQVAASAFWNSGGGILIVGIDDKGRIDGGISDVMGRQRLRDWVDRVVSHVEPAGPYLAKLIYREAADSPILEGNCVLVVAYGESSNAPHMAPDKRYYVRAGAHSDPAGHFLVEAIRARRRLQKPMLRGLLRANRAHTRLLDLVILALNETPALDVHLDFDGLPVGNEDHLAERLPLYIPVIDRDHPFMMDAGWFDLEPNGNGRVPLLMRLTFQDLGGREYEFVQELDPRRSLAPFYAPTAEE